MNNKTERFSFEIKEHLGVLKTYSTGWKKELNLVEWNGKGVKFDIRDWDSKHEKMSRGITLHEDEAKKLADLLQKYMRNRNHNPHSGQSSAQMVQETTVNVEIQDNPS